MAGTSYFIGLDNGGTATKCVLFDDTGAVAGAASARVPSRKPREGFTERDPEAWWHANVSAIREALAMSGVRPGQVRSIASCGYGGGLVMVGEDGACPYPAIVSTDFRTGGLLSEFQRDGTAEAVYARTLQRPWPGQPAMLLPWFARHAPEVLAKSRHFLSAKDYIRYRLTGEVATEPTDASNTNLFNLAGRYFDPEIFAALGIGECLEKMPRRLLSPFGSAGGLTAEAAAETGLTPGIPVAAGLYDVAACTLASGITDESILTVVLGTWVISGHMARSYRELVGQGNGMCAYRDGWYFSEESSPAAASNLDWFVEQFFARRFAGEANVYEACNRLVASMDPAASDLVFLPYLYGSNSVPEARGTFFNLAGHHSADHVLAAVYEGILFSLLQHVKNLYPGELPALARFSGGMARSPLWCRMLADVLGTAVEVTACPEPGTLGAAICATVAAGRFPGYAQAVQAMVHVTERFEPDPARHAVYREKYRAYERAVAAAGAFYRGRA